MECYPYYYYYYYYYFWYFIIKSLLAISMITKYFIITSWNVPRIMWTIINLNYNSSIRKREFNKEKGLFYVEHKSLSHNNRQEGNAKINGNSTIHPHRLLLTWMHFMHIPSTSKIQESTMSKNITQHISKMVLCIHFNS